MSDFCAIEAVLGFSGDFDLRDSRCKELVNRLNKEPAALARADSRTYNMVELGKAIDGTLFFPRISQSLKDLYFISMLKNCNYNYDDCLRAIDVNNPGYSGWAYCASRLLYNGIIECAAGKYSLGAMKILKANQDNFANNIITPFLSYSKSIIFDPVEIVWPCELEVQSVGRSAILCSSDAVYAKKFLTRYVETLNARPDDGLVDFVLVLVADDSELDGELLSLLSSARAGYAKGELKVERVDKPDFKDVRTFFAMARFLHAKKWLLQYDGLIITDIDYQLRVDGYPLGKFISEIRTKSLAVNEADKGCFSFMPWRRYTAGTVWVRNDSIGGSFLDYVNALFVKNYNSNCYNWGLDQNILYFLFSTVRRESYTNIRRSKSTFQVPRDLK